jgi:VCBS repeat-containing protein
MPDNSIQIDTSTSILFVGNSFTFGRVDPVMSYNTANVTDMTAPVPGTSFEDTTGGNVFEPHPWGGVPGIFEVFTNQVGLDYDVSLSTRNAASLQGHYLNSNPAGWDMLGNVASQSWDTLVLQDNSSRALPSGSGTITFAPGETTVRLVVAPTTDAKLEADETLILQLNDGDGYRVGTTGEVIGTILDDDVSLPVIDPDLPTVTLVASPSAVAEDGEANLTYTFTRTGPLDQPLVIDFLAERDGSTAPSVNTSTGDFENFVSQFRTSFSSDGVQTQGNLSFNAGGGSVIIPAGASSVTFTLNPRPDTQIEADESIRLSLANSDGYNVGTLGPVTATILNDDLDPETDPSLPNITMNLASATVYEDGDGNLVYEFHRSGAASDALTVGFEVSGTATLPSGDFTVTGADSFETAGAENPNLASFNTYAVKLAEYATTGAADGEIAANANANLATQVYLYETWARPDLVLGALERSTDEETGEVTTFEVSAPEYYLSLEDMTDDLRDAYRGLAEANPIFRGVAPVGEAFLLAVQQGVATRDPYAPDAGSDGKVDLWWDDNLHASKYGSYLSSLTLFGTITGVDPRALGAQERAAADLGITTAEAAALQDIAAATLGFSLDAHWTAPGQVTELRGDAGVLATAGAFGFADSDIDATHSVTASALTTDALGGLDVTLHADTTGDGTGGAVNWTYTVDSRAVDFLAPGETRSERFLVTITDDRGGVATQEVEVVITGSDDDAPIITSGDGAASLSLQMAENTEAVTTIAAFDPEGALPSYAIAGGADAAAFSIDAKTGELRFNTAPNYEAPTDSDQDNIYEVIVQASDGAGAARQSISVTINDVDDPASIGGDATGRVTEDGQTTTGGLLTIADEDQGQAGFQTPPSLSGDYGRFTFDPTSGAWSYDLDNDAEAVQMLGDGDVLQDSLMVTSLDGSASQVISVRIDGTSEQIVGKPGQFLLKGTDGADIITVGRSNLLVHAGDGDDVIRFAAGSKFSFHALDGDAGQDTLDLSDLTGDSSINLGSGIMLGKQIGLGTIKSIENVVGGQGDDVIRGDGGDNSLRGGLGADTIRGGAGDDMILGQGDGDVLFGGKGADQFVFVDEISDGQTSVLKIRDHDDLDRIDIGDAEITSVAVQGRTLQLTVGDDADLIVIHGVKDFDDLQFV